MDNFYKKASVKREKYSVEQIKKVPTEILLKLINRAKKDLKKDPTMKEIFNDHNVDIEYLDHIPMMFGDIDTSAKTVKGVIILNYKLLCEGDLKINYDYICHETDHYLGQCFSNGPTEGASSDNYLQSPEEQDAFGYQVKYIANHEGEDEAEKYVDDLLNYHEIDDKEEKEELKDTLLDKV